MRSKEEANDYRYFPDPDLLPLAIEDALIDEVRAALPELPDEKAARFSRDFELSAYDAGVLTASRELAEYYEAVVGKLGGEPKLAANWVMGELSGALNRDGLEVEQSKVPAVALAVLLARIGDGTISGKQAKDVFDAMWAGEAGGDDAADRIIAARGLKQISDTGALESAVDAVIEEFPEQLADYRGGNEKLLQFFVGQAMKRLRGQGNPQQLNALLRDKLKM
jgi:aspartyl-tRNA(Asn)/glutamyl-tRNA(Gln) amidotransferase subunit B